MKIKQLLLLVTAILFLIGCCKQETAVTRTVTSAKNISLDSIVKLYKNPSDQYVMVIAHRAAWRNFPENSLEAIRSAIKIDVEMVEVEVEVYKAVMGQSWEFVADYFFEKAGIEPEMKAFNAEFKKIYQELLFKELTPNLNCLALLTKLKAKGKKMGVVSSATKWMADQILLQLKLMDFFDFIITNEDVTNHKPHSEAYLLALEKLTLPSSEVLIFEDSEAGLIAANNANCDSVAFKHDFNANHDLSLAIRTISDFNDI